MADGIKWIRYEPGRYGGVTEESRLERFLIQRAHRAWLLTDLASNHPPNPPTVHATLAQAKLAAEHIVNPRYTIYCCADATLTYAPYGSPDKIIPQALPVCEVSSPEEAQSLVTLVGSVAYEKDLRADPHYMQQRRGVAIPADTGPPQRTRYSLGNFKFNDVTTLPAVRATMEALRDAQRAGDNDAVRQAFEKAGPRV